MGMYVIEIELLIYTSIICFIVFLAVLITERLKKKDTATILRHISTGLFIVYMLFILTVTIFLRGLEDFELLLYLIILGLIAFLVIFIIDKLKKRDSATLFRHVTTGLVSVYLLFLLLVIVFFQDQVERENLGADLIPFRNLIDIFRDKTYRELYEVIFNILVFIPLSFFLSGALPNRKCLPIICGFTITVSIEITQYLSKRGVFDINDIIFNFIGTLIGYGIYILFRKICEKIAKRKNNNVIQP